jgi:signal transduction histidine kinase
VSAAGTVQQPDDFGLSRVYAVASVVVIFIAAVALAVLYRELSIRIILEFGEQTNVIVAQTALNVFRAELADYLEIEESLDRQPTTKTMPPQLLSMIKDSVRDTAIARINVYDRDGRILYSTRSPEIRADGSADQGFKDAIAGRVASTLTYVDFFDVFRQRSENDNLIETYVPVIHPGQQQPLGVFEIYTDVNSIVRGMTRNEVLVLTGIVLIMLILYSALLYVAWRADKVIAYQRQALRERNRTLELLSARMLAAEDAERRRVALELHEEVAQTLGAVKAMVEAHATTASASDARVADERAAQVVPLMQGVIRDVRDLAMELRPPSLDDFGLLATVRWLCRETEQVHPDLQVTADLALREEQLRADLKGVIFRILQETLRQARRVDGIATVAIGLGHSGGEVALRVELGVSEPGSVLPDPDGAIEAVWERAILSGGTFEKSQPTPATWRYRAIWAASPD